MHVLTVSFAKFARWYAAKLARTLSDVWICAYAFFAVILLNVAVPRTSQGIELGAVAFRDFSWPRLLLMGVSVTYCAVSIWIAASSSLTNAARKRTGARPHAGQLKSTLPFWFGALILISAIGLVIGNETRKISSLNFDDATTLNVVALLMLLAIPFAPRHFAGSAHTWPVVRPARGLAHRVHGHLARRRLQYEIVLTAVGLIVFIACTGGGPPVARTLSTWVIAYVAVGFWALWGSRVFIAWPRLAGWPSLWALPIGWALLFSNWNDNHEIDGGVYGEPRAAWPTPRSFAQAFEQWRSAHPCSRAPCALRIVAAEGGGLRAAFWTAAVLDALDRRGSKSSGTREKPFSDSVFAVSSVSGGSLGTLAYFGGESLRNASCDPSAFVRSFVGDDHLSPVMAGLVFGNAFQWLLPWSFPGLDRAKQFEQNMSQRWSADVVAKCNGGANIFDRPFPAGMPAFPVLFLNATNVETGKRIILSTVAKPEAGRACGLPEPACIDAYWAFDPAASLRLRSLPARTAVTLSASFPLITPAGTAYQHDAGGQKKRLWGRIVDGGYLDGTGLMTAYDVANEVRKLDEGHTFRVTILFISNDPSIGAGQENARDDVPEPLDPPARLLITTDRSSDREAPNPNVPAHPPWDYEIGGIVTAALNAHWESPIESARRSLAAFRSTPPEDKLRACKSLFADEPSPGDDFCEISLGALTENQRDPRPPLGWFLSPSTQNHMRDAADCYVDVLNSKDAQSLDRCTKKIPTQIR